MVTKAAPKSATKTATAKVAEKPAEKPEFSWDDLPELETVEYTRGAIVSHVDVEADTPELIKAKVKASYAAYQEAVEKADGSTFDKERKLWVTDNQRENMLARMAAGRRQQCGTEERAAEFLRLAKRYGSHSGMTVRGDVDPKNKTVAVFYAKPRETRTRNSK